MTVMAPQTRLGGPQFSGLEQSMRTLGARVAQPLMTVGSSRSGTPIRLALTPLLPSIAVGSAALYQHGLQRTHPNAQDRISTRRMLVESGFGYLMSAFASGIFPLLYGIGLAAYRAGQKDNRAEQLHAVVNTAATLGLGYLGIFLFSGLSEGQHRAENEAIHRALKDPHVYPWLTSLMGRTDANSQELTRTLHRLYEGLETHEQLINRQKPDHAALKTLRSELNGIKAEASAGLRALEDTALRPSDALGAKAYQGLREAVGKSQTFAVRFARITNPLAGFFLMGLMLGPLAAKGLNAWLDKIFPNLRQKPGLQSLISGNSSIVPPEVTLNSLLPWTSGTQTAPAGH